MPVFDENGVSLSKSGMLSVIKNLKKLSELDSLLKTIEDGKVQKNIQPRAKLTDDDLDLNYYSLALIEKNGKQEPRLIKFSINNIYFYC